MGGCSSKPKSKSDESLQLGNAHFYTRMFYAQACHSL